MGSTSTSKNRAGKMSFKTTVILYNWYPRRILFLYLESSSLPPRKIWPSPIRLSPPPGFYISLSWTGITLVEERFKLCADSGESFDLWGHGDKVYIISTRKCNYCHYEGPDTSTWIWSANADEFSAKFPVSSNGCGWLRFVAMFTYVFLSEQCFNLLFTIVVSLQPSQNNETSNFTELKYADACTHS